MNWCLHNPTDPWGRKFGSFHFLFFSFRTASFFRRLIRIRYLNLTMNFFSFWNWWLSQARFCSQIFSEPKHQSISDQINFSDLTSHFLTSLTLILGKHCLLETGTFWSCLRNLWKQVHRFPPWNLYDCFLLRKYLFLQIRFIYFTSQCCFSRSNHYYRWVVIPI